MAGNVVARPLTLPIGARARTLELRRRARRRRIARAVALLLVVGTLTAVAVKEGIVSSAFPQKAVNERISAPAADDVVPNQGGFAPAMSADGRYVAYLANISDSRTNIYVTDRVTRVRSLVPMAEFPGGGARPLPFQTVLAATDISDSGRIIAFETSCAECGDKVGVTDRGNPIVAPPPQGFYPVMLAPVSSSCAGQGTVQRLLGMSGDGTQILLDESCSESDNVFVWDRTKPAGAQLVGVAVPGGESFIVAGGPREASISSNGSRVAIVGVLLCGGCEFGPTQVYVWDRDVDGNGVLDEANSGTTIRESFTQVPHDFPDPLEVAISGNGRIVAVTNVNQIPNPNPTRNLLDVWIVDTARPAATSTTRLTRTSNAQLGQSYAPSLSFDGRYVAFVSTGTHFVSLPPDTPAFICGLTSGVLCRVYLADRIGVGGAPIFELASEGMVAGSLDPPVIALTQVNGLATTTFPTSTAPPLTTVGGTCGAAAGDAPLVNVAVTGADVRTGTAPCNAGQWTFTFSPALTGCCGQWIVTATQVDNAGNTDSSGPKSINQILIQSAPLDRTAPAVQYRTVAAVTPDIPPAGGMSTDGNSAIHTMAAPSDTVVPPSPDYDSFGALQDNFPSITLPPGLPPAISANGRLVAFRSFAGNLVGPTAECDSPTVIGQSCDVATQGEDHDSDVFVHNTQPGLQGTPNPLVFTDTTVNTTSVPRIVTFQHKRDPNSYGRVTIPATGSVSITGPDASQFALVPADTCLGAVIDAGGSCAVRVVFKPTHAAPAFADLVVHYDGNDQPATVRVTGTGTTRVVTQQTALGPSLDFGKNVLTVPKTLTTTLKNVAGVPLTGISVSVIQNGVAFVPSGCGATLAAGNSCAIKVTFTATVFQPSPIAIGDLKVTTTTPSVPAMSISLKGEAAVPAIRVLPAVSYPGGVVQVVGRNWPPGQLVTLQWLNTVGDGLFPGVQELDLPVVASVTYPNITQPDKDQFKSSVLVFPRADVGSRKLDAETPNVSSPPNRYHAPSQPVLLVQTPQVTGELNFVFRDG